MSHRHCVPNSRKPRNLRRLGVIGGLAGAGLAAAGMAFAAVVFTTSVTGEATIKNVPGAQPTTTTTAPPTTTTDPAKPAVALSVSGNQNGNLDCRQVGISADYTKLTFKPVLSRVDGQQAEDESCVLTVKVRNTGTTPVRVSPEITVPAGWQVGPIGHLGGPVQPAQVVEGTIGITAHPDAVAGQFGGQFVFSDN